MSFCMLISAYLLLAADGPTTNAAQNQYHRLGSVPMHREPIDAMRRRRDVKAAAEIRDGRLRKLTKRERIQLQLACGISFAVL
jgi:hypothetical protein